MAQNGSWHVVTRDRYVSGPHRHQRDAIAALQHLNGDKSYDIQKLAPGEYEYIWHGARRERGRTRHFIVDDAHLRAGNWPRPGNELRALQSAMRQHSTIVQAQAQAQTQTHVRELTPDEVERVMDKVWEGTPLESGRGEEKRKEREDMATIQIERYLQRVAQVIREEGWMPRTQARNTGEVATADLAFDLYHDPQATPPTKADRELARAALEFGQHELGESDNNFDRALYDKLYGAEVVDTHDMGTVASLIERYKRWVGWERRDGEDLRRQAALSTHQGTVRGKLTRQVRITRRKPVTRATTPTILTIMEDADGNAYVFFDEARRGQTTRGVAGWYHEYELEEGDSYTVTGRVRRHDTMYGVQQTVLEHCEFELLPDRPHRTAQELTSRRA